MSTRYSLSLSKPRSAIALLAFLVVVIGVGAFIGTRTAPGLWYEALEKPPFNPPGWVFGPVWFTLYVMIAIAGWRSFMRGPMTLAMGLWIGQMLLNWLWSPTFFLAQNLWLAMAVILTLLALIICYVGINWKRDSVAAWLFIPYLAWVSFATLLNFSLAILN